MNIERVTIVLILNEAITFQIAFAEKQRAEEAARAAAEGNDGGKA